MGIEEKFLRLKAIVARMGSAVVAYSGGVDSTLLTKVCHDILGKKALAVTVLTPFVPRSERMDAQRFACRIGIRHRFLIMAGLPRGTQSNPKDRCYLCKKEIFSGLLRLAKAEGLAGVLDGSNADDRRDFRPGAKALKELKVRSPLQEAGLGKEDIRIISRSLRLGNWDKPACACLASRFPYGEEFTARKLRMVERAEDYLKSIGFKQVRVRYHAGVARIEVEPKQLNMLMRKGRDIDEHLRSLGFGYVTADLKGYRTGSMNELWKNPR
jgi:uncharacterized protein